MVWYHIWGTASLRVGENLLLTVLPFGGPPHRINMPSVSNPTFAALCAHPVRRNAQGHSTFHEPSRQPSSTREGSTDFDLRFADRTGRCGREHLIGYEPEVAGGRRFSKSARRRGQTFASFGPISLKEYPVMRTATRGLPGRLLNAKNDCDTPREILRDVAGRRAACVHHHRSRPALRPR